MNGLTLACGGKKEKRKDADFYPTPPDVTHALMRFLALSPLRVHEPACGDGSMSRVIGSYGHEVLSTDLRETGYGIGGRDFLLCEEPSEAIITNPPFCLSEQFIRHALGLAPIVAMLTKTQYWHSKKRSALFYEFPPAYILALTWRPDFSGKAVPQPSTMDVIWTVWISGKTDTKYRLLDKEVTCKQELI